MVATGGTYWFIAFFGIFVIICLGICVMIYLWYSSFLPHMRRVCGCCCWIDWDSYNQAREIQHWSLQIAQNSHVLQTTDIDNSLHRLKEGLSDEQRLQILAKVLPWRVFVSKMKVGGLESYDVESPPEKEVKFSDQHDPPEPNGMICTGLDTSPLENGDIEQAVNETSTESISVAEEMPNEMPSAVPARSNSQSEVVDALCEPNTSDCCSICLELFKDGQIVNDNHQHTFHRDCLMGWLDHHLACPYCRKCLVTRQEWTTCMEELGIQPAGTSQA